MRYEVINRGELIQDIFERIKQMGLVRHSYKGDIVSNIIDKLGNALVYESEKRILTIVGDKRRSLIKKFNELISENKIELKQVW